MLASVTACLVQVALCEGKAIPFEDIVLTVRVGRLFGVMKKEPDLDFTVWAQRDSAKPLGSAWISSRCSGFKNELDTMTEEDLAAFLEVGKAAKEGREMRIEVNSQTAEGKPDTVYKVIFEDGKRVMRVFRDKESLDFPLNSIARVSEEAAEAKAARAWFEKLFTADEIPEVTPDARPPRSDRCSIRAGAENIWCKGFTYMNGAAANWSPNSQHLTMPRLMVQRKGGIAGHLVGGEWMEALFKDIALATDAAADGKVIVLRGKGDNLIEYWVRSNIGTKEAEITLTSPAFATGGSIGKTELAEIQRVKSETEARLEWIKKNETLFFTPIPKKKGILSLFD